jgi:dihydroorotase
MANISLFNGRVIDPATGLDAEIAVHIADGKILALGDAPVNFTPDWTLDLTGQIIIPGLVDLSVRLREPGAEQKGTIASESRAAANSGITSLCCPPDTTPVIDTPAVVELIQQRTANVGMAKVYPLAALTKGLEGTQLSEMGSLKKAGCLGVSNAMRPIINTEVFRHALEYAATHDLTVFLQAQDAYLGQGGCMHESAISTRLGLAGIPEAAETIEVARDLLLIALTEVRAHFGKLSCAQSVDMLKQAQDKGLRVTADVAAHQLFLTDMDVCDYNTHCHVYPPLRSQRDVTGLRQALREGIICAISSDHQPHEPDAKDSPFMMTEAGISAVDTLLPLVLRLAKEMALPLTTVLAWITSEPAKILGIDAGRIAVGSAADLCIFDPQYRWYLESDSMHSAGHNSPFLGWEFIGRVTYTLIDGRVVYTFC